MAARRTAHLPRARAGTKLYAARHRDATRPGSHLPVTTALRSAGSIRQPCSCRLFPVPFPLFP